MSKGGLQSPAESGSGVSVLMGRYDHSLDPKKRFTIPSEWRQVMGGPDYVFVIPDPRERCLDLIPPDMMEARLQEFRSKALFDPAIARNLEIIGENSEQLMLDVQGRIRVCDRFLKFAGITGKVAMVGSLTKIRIWNPDALGPADEVDQKKLGKAMEAIGF